MRLLLVFILFFVSLTFCMGWVYRIAWDYDDPDVVFRVYRSVQGQDPALIAETPYKLFCDWGATEGRVYVYCVSAVNPEGVESDLSDGLVVESGFRGDVNCDGVVDWTDRTTMARYLAGFIFLLVGRRADMNDDFILDAVDLVIMWESVF